MNVLIGIGVIILGGLVFAGSIPFTLITGVPTGVTGMALVVFGVWIVRSNSKE